MSYASTSSAGTTERRYAYTLIGDVRVPDAAGKETGQLNQLSNVYQVSISEITIRFGADITILSARPFFLRFASQQFNIAPNDLNAQRNQSFYFTPEAVAPDCLRWQAANEQNGLLQTTDQNLLKLNTLTFVVHDASNDTPVAYAQCVVRFIITTMGSAFGSQSTLQQVNLNPSQVVGVWAN